MPQFQIAAVVAGVIVEQERYASGIETIPLEKSYASESALVRLGHYLQPHLIAALGEEKKTALFDQADPLGIVTLPWSAHGSVQQALEYGRGVLRSLLATIGFARGEKGRPICLIIWELSPPAAAPTIHVEWEVPQYRGNFIRNAMSGAANIFDTLCEAEDAGIDLIYFFEFFVDAKREDNPHLAISKYWYLIENLASRSSQIRNTMTAPSKLIWKGNPASGTLETVWNYVNSIPYFPLMAGNGEYDFGKCLGLSQMFSFVSRV